MTSDDPHQNEPREILNGSVKPKGGRRSTKVVRKKHASLQAELSGSGAISQGTDAQAVGKGGLLIKGNVENSNVIVGDGNQIIIYQGKKVTIPSAEAVARHRDALKERLEKEAITRWGRMTFYIQEDGANLPLDASPYQAEELGERLNLQATMKSSKRMLVLGDPGSGKSVALERFAWELCTTNEPVIPVIIRLFRYAGGSLADWVRARLHEVGCLRLDNEESLIAFLKDGPVRFVFLFDGLNEVAPDSRKFLVNELDLWIATYPNHAVILTSRIQDELWRSLRGELPVYMVQSIRPQQVRDYLISYLGAAKGSELYKHLDEHLLDLARNPLVLWLIKEAGAADESLPGNRGELYSRFVKRMLRRDKDRNMETTFSEREKQNGLAALAYHMNKEQKLVCPRNEAIEVLVNTFEKDVPEKLAKAEALASECALHGLLVGEEILWFAPHQTVQEHFAAVALKDVVHEEEKMSKVKRIWRIASETLTSQKVGLSSLADNEWWMETLVQLAGLVDDPSWLVISLAEVNPWLAWWCIQEGRTVDESTRLLIENRSSNLIKSPIVADRRRAAQTLARTNNARVLIPLLDLAADKDKEVSRIASQAMVDMGEIGQIQVMDLLQKSDENTWKTTLHCLTFQPESNFWSGISKRIGENTELLDMAHIRIMKQAGLQQRNGNTKALSDTIKTLVRIESRQVAIRFWKMPYGEPEWVTVPAGEFWMEGEGEYDGKLLHKVYLPEYQIARVPVTNAQYALFMKGANYKAPDGWEESRPPKGKESHPVVSVSWNDARAYCIWLSGMTDKNITLPSEAEWEKAARGDKDQRAFPWGDNFDPVRCNTVELGLGSTTPVGIFLEGASPYGILDMSGNVWEWTRSIRDDKKFKYPHKTDDGREDLHNGDLPRILRGGAFDDVVDHARCAPRYRYYSLNWPSFGGFRLVLSRVLLF